MTTPNLNILCIEDDEDTCDLITFVFNDAGYEVKACSQADCLTLIHEERFAAIILDNFFVDMSGVEICRRIREFDRHTPIVFLSGDVRRSEIEKAMAAGADTYLTKPSDFERLVPTVVSLISERQSSQF